MKTLLVALGCSLLTPLLAQSSRHVHHDHVPVAPRVYLYSEPNFAGECLILEPGQDSSYLKYARDRRGQKWDDRITSVRLEVAALPPPPAFHEEPPPPGPALSRREAEHLVRASFRDILNREPTRRETDTYLRSVLNEGWDINRLNAALRRFPEFRNRDVSAIVKRAYQAELGRDPDPSGIATYSSRLREDGWTERELCEHLRNSSEARERNARLAITHAYRELLQREPDPSGFDAFLNAMLHRGWDEKRVRDAIRGSDEYRRLHTGNR